MQTRVIASVSSKKIVVLLSSKYNLVKLVLLENEYCLYALINFFIKCENSIQTKQRLQNASYIQILKSSKASYYFSFSISFSIFLFQFLREGFKAAN